MILDFQQGVITYPTVLGLQTFLAYSSGFVSLQTTNGRVDVTFAHGAQNYLVSESASVNNAWGPLTGGVDYWLYWDINTRTGVRTFGATQLTPFYGASFPGTPVEDQHWFDTSARKMYVYTSGAFREVIRVFAAKVNSSTFVPLGSGFPSLPYAGTQAGLLTPNMTTGRIVFDNAGNPVRRVDGRFFTTEDDFFVEGSPVNAVRLESSILTGTANENIAKYQIAKFVEFGRLELAEYDDIGATAIVIAMENMTVGQTGTVCVQGHIINPTWNWGNVGAPLWVDGGLPGVLTETDAHVANASVYPQGRVPIGRVITPTSIIFDQGLGGKGDRGESGAIAGINLATTTVLGIAKLSTPAADAGNPIVVGDNDVRLSNKVLRAGDTMTGPLVLSGDPVVALGAATKQYVDTRVLRSGDTMTGLLTLSADPTIALHASTKQYVDNTTVSLAGDTMTGLLVLSGDPVAALGAVTKQYVDSRTLNDVFDVSITTPANGHGLVYNTGQWVNAPILGSTNLAAALSPTTVTISSDTGTDATIPAATTSDAGVLSASDKTKLDGIAIGATANSSDSFLTNRINHTGQQPASTISDFSEAVDDRVSTLLVAGTNVSLTYNDVANTLTIDATAAPSQAEVQFQDEGSNLGSSGTATVVDFVGAGVTATRISNTVTVTIPGGQSSIQFAEEGSNLGSSGTVTSFNVVGPSATLTRSVDSVTLTIQATQGRHSIPVLAGAMRPSVTGGCAALATLASAANQPDIQTLDFDATVQEYAQFSLPMPKSWDEGTITFKPIWSHAATATDFGVVWDLQAVAVSDDDGIAVAFGTAQTSTDTGGTTDDIYIGPESSAITVAGSPSSEDIVFFRLSRVTGDGNDTLAIDARLHGIILYITTDAENDA